MDWEVNKEGNEVSKAKNGKYDLEFMLFNRKRDDNLISVNLEVSGGDNVVGKNQLDCRGNKDINGDKLVQEVKDAISKGVVKDLHGFTPQEAADAIRRAVEAAYRDNVAQHGDQGKEAKTEKLSDNNSIKMYWQLRGNRDWTIAVDEKGVEGLFRIFEEQNRTGVSVEGKVRNQLDVAHISNDKGWGLKDKDNQLVDEVRRALEGAFIKFAYDGSGKGKVGLYELFNEMEEQLAKAKKLNTEEKPKAMGCISKDKKEVSLFSTVDEIEKRKGVFGQVEDYTPYMNVPEEEKGKLFYMKYTFKPVGQKPEYVLLEQRAGEPNKGMEHMQVWRFRDDFSPASARVFVPQFYRHEKMEQERVAGKESKEEGMGR